MSDISIIVVLPLFFDQFYLKRKKFYAKFRKKVCLGYRQIGRKYFYRQKSRVPRSNLAAVVILYSVCTPTRNALDLSIHRSNKEHTNT